MKPQFDTATTMFWCKNDGMFFEGHSGICPMCLNRAEVATVMYRVRYEASP